MNTIKDGGPAFPFPSSLYPDGSTHEPGEVGMSLRDYFAAKALPVVAAGAQNVGEDFLDPRNYSSAAFDAYRLADAMLAAREAS